jgi:hypothetical protein
MTGITQNESDEREISCTTVNEREWCVVIRSRVLVVKP